MRISSPITYDGGDDDDGGGGGGKPDYKDDATDERNKWGMLRKRCES